MKALIISVATAAVLALLALTNPDTEDYSRYLRDEMSDGGSDEDEIAEAVRGVFGGIAGGLLASASSRDNYLLFSIYTTDLGTDELVTLGILGNFVVLREN